MTLNIEPGLQSILDNTNTIVASEGGSLELVDVKASKLTVKYTPGVNEECPECVPDHTLVKMMMETSVSVSAPYIREIELL